MIRIYRNHTLQANTWHHARVEEPQSTYSFKTSGKFQIKATRPRSYIKKIMLNSTEHYIYNWI